MSMKLDFLSIKHKKYHNTKAPSVTKSRMNRKVLGLTHIFFFTHNRVRCARISVCINTEMIF